MYNLVPAVGEINNRRSNYSFAQIPGNKNQFGKCDVKIINRKIEPLDNVKGNIAKIYFYMDKSYQNRGIISAKNRRLFKTWDKQDPVDDWECERCKKIARIQGNSNSIVKKACIRSKKW
jgi:deoxyribonuclease I